MRGVDTTRVGAAESGERRAARLRAAAAAMDSVDPQAAVRRRSVAERIEKGNAGEQRVGELLDVLDGAGWVVLHDRYKSARSPANLDHVVVGPPGVFVVDAKNWTGARLRLDERGLALDGRRRDRALHAARADADLVGQLVAAVVPGVAPVGVLAFVQDVGLGGPSAAPAGDGAAGRAAVELVDLAAAAADGSARSSSGVDVGRRTAGARRQPCAVHGSARSGRRTGGPGCACRFEAPARSPTADVAAGSPAGVSAAAGASRGAGAAITSGAAAVARATRGPAARRPATDPSRVESLLTWLVQQIALLSMPGH